MLQRSRGHRGAEATEKATDKATEEQPCAPAQSLLAFGMSQQGFKQPRRARTCLVFGVVFLPTFSLGLSGHQGQCIELCHKCSRQAAKFKSGLGCRWSRIHWTWCTSSPKIWG